MAHRSGKPCFRRIPGFLLGVLCASAVQLRFLKPSWVHGGIKLKTHNLDREQRGALAASLVIALRNPSGAPSKRAAFLNSRRKYSYTGPARAWETTEDDCSLHPAHFS